MWIHLKLGSTETQHATTVPRNKLQRLFYSVFICCCGDSVTSIMAAAEIKKDNFAFKTLVQVIENAGGVAMLNSKISAMQTNLFMVLNAAPYALPLKN